MRAFLESSMTGQKYGRPARALGKDFGEWDREDGEWMDTRGR